VRLARIEAQAGIEPAAVPVAWPDLAEVHAAGEAAIDVAGALTVACRFSASYSHSASADPASASESATVRIAADFLLVYELRESAIVTTQDANEFASVNGLLHAWPYWRELAQSTSVRMGFPPLIIQTFKIPSPYDPDAAKATDEQQETAATETGSPQQPQQPSEPTTQTPPSPEPTAEKQP